MTTSFLKSALDLTGATTLSLQMQRPEEISVDLSACNDESSLFKHLWRKLDFPSLYAVSWHGFGENMFYDPDMRMPDILIVRGLDSFADVDPVSAKKLKTALSDYLLDQPDRKVIYEQEQTNQGCCEVAAIARDFDCALD